MAKESCIAHTRSYRVTVHKDYLDMFDGDACAAVLLWIFEFATNGEIHRLKLAEEDGEPWVKASVASLVEDALSVYSARSIYERLSWLKTLGFLSVDKTGGGKINRYLLDSEAVSGALRTCKIYKLPDCKIAVSETELTAPLTAPLAAKKTLRGGVLNLKEEEIQKEEIILYPPAALSEVATIGEFRRCCEKNGIKIKQGERAEAEEKLLASGISSEAMWNGVPAFCEWAPVPTWRGYLKDPHRWALAPPVDLPPLVILPRTADAPQPAQTPANAITEPLFEELYRDHPKKAFRHLAERALAGVMGSSLNPQETADRIRKSHADWVPEWERDGGKYAPRLDRWIEASGWLDDPPVNGKVIDYTDPKRYELGD